MKIVRSTKCSTKFATDKKKAELKTVLTEYGEVVNVFIDYFWTNPTDKTKLLKPIVDIPKDTWLSARLRKVAAREALDMVDSVKNVFEWNKEQIQNTIDALERKIKDTKANTREKRRKINSWHKKLKANKSKISMVQPHKPKHKGYKMSISCTIGELQRPKKTTKEFDAWLHLASIGNKMSLDIPIKFHKHYRELEQTGQRLNSYVITKDYVQFCFERETGPKKGVKNIIGIDTGINALASTSDKLQFGTDIKTLIEKSKRCKKGSKGKQRAINTIEYENELENLLYDNKFIPHGSLIECEIRASSILACKMLSDKSGYNMGTIDQYLWSRRKECTDSFHLTVTTDY